MKIDHEFTIDAPIARVWDAMVDPERVVTCVPGASLDAIDGDAFQGRISMKLGPMSLTYKGEGKLSAEPEHQRILISGQGVEQRGAGTAAASISVRLSPAAGDRTLTSVGIDLDLAGKPAQFGRGILAEVAARLAGDFAKRLERQLSEGADGNVTPTPIGAQTGRAEPAESLNLVDLGRAVLVRRAAPIAAALGVSILIAVLLRRLGRNRISRA
jgi:carbon monoxide dehydrogenase subunit G